MKRNDDLYPSRVRRPGTGLPDRIDEFRIPLEAVTQYVSELGPLLGPWLPPGPPGPPGIGGPKQIAFFNFWPYASWTTDPPHSELGGSSKFNRWIADVSGCGQIRVSAMCHASGGGPALLAVEYSSDGLTWLGGYTGGNYVTLDPGSLPVTSGWTTLADDSVQYFRLVLINEEDPSKAVATAELGPITVEVRPTP